MKIEELGIIELRKSLAKTDFLESDIRINDKTPSWDGEVYLYKNKKKTKEGIEKIAVQVKSIEKKTKKLIEKENISYTIALNDMKNYFNDGGVIYFVIHVHMGINNVENYQIYYISLLPFLIDNYLKKQMGSKNIKVRLRAFPLDNNEKIDIFNNFVINRKKQSILLGNRGLMNVNLENEFKNIKNFDVFFSSIDEITPFNAIFNNTMYVYAKKEVFGTNIHIPVKAIDVTSITQEEKIDVTINNNKYYDAIKKVMQKNKYELYLGASITFLIDTIKKMLRLIIN